MFKKSPLKTAWTKHLFSIYTVTENRKKKRKWGFLSYCCFICRVGCGWQIQKENPFLNSNESVACEPLDLEQQHEHKNTHLKQFSSHSCRLVCLNMQAWRKESCKLPTLKNNLQTHTLRNRCTHRVVIQLGITTLGWHLGMLKQVSEHQQRQSNSLWREKNSQDLRHYSTLRLCGIFPLKHCKDPNKHVTNTG